MLSCLPLCFGSKSVAIGCPCMYWYTVGTLISSRTRRTFFCTYPFPSPKYDHSQRTLVAFSFLSAHYQIWFIRLSHVYALECDSSLVTECCLRIRPVSWLPYTFSFWHATDGSAMPPCPLKLVQSIIFPCSVVWRFHGAPTFDLVVVNQALSLPW